MVLVGLKAGEGGIGVFGASCHAVRWHAVLLFFESVRGVASVNVNGEGGVVDVDEGRR